MEMKFDDLGINEILLKALKELNYEEPTPIQREAIPHLLNGEDVIGLAQTGTGKTCAFGLPLLEKIDLESNKVQAIVIAPTRELAMQITNELRKYSKYVEGLRMECVYGGESIEKQIKELKKKPQIIVGTPGRIMDHMRRHTLKLENINMVVLDEADEMLNMGFKEDIDTILSDIPETKQMVMFSATFNEDLHMIAETYQKAPLTINVRKQQVASLNIKQCLIEVSEANKNEVLTRILDANAYSCSIIFCNTKKKVDEVCEFLHIHGYRVKAIHGDMKQKERDFVMNLLRKSQLDILVATDVAARGIDVDNIEAVINYDVPEDEEYYVHRIGRCGRAGREGISYLLSTKRQKNKLKYIEKLTKVPLVPVGVPTAEDIKNRQMENLIAEIRDLESFDSEAEEVISTIARNTAYDTLEIAKALYTLFTKKLFKEVNDDLQSFDVEPGHTRIYINLGNEDHVSPAQIIKFVASNTGVAGKKIGAIDINGYYSYFEVPTELADKVFKISGEFESDGKQIFLASEVNVEWRKMKSKKSSKPSREGRRDGGRGGKNGGRDDKRSNSRDDRRGNDGGRRRGGNDSRKNDNFKSNKPKKENSNKDHKPARGKEEKPKMQGRKGKKKEM